MICGLLQLLQDGGAATDDDHGEGGDDDDQRGPLQDGKSWLAGLALSSSCRPTSIEPGRPTRRRRSGEPGGAGADAKTTPGQPHKLRKVPCSLAAAAEAAPPATTATSYT